MNNNMTGLLIYRFFNVQTEHPKVLELNRLTGSCLKLAGPRLIVMVLLEDVLAMSLEGEFS